MTDRPKSLSIALPPGPAAKRGEAKAAKWPQGTAYADQHGSVRLLALDPSSSAVGFALLLPALHLPLVTFGVIWPRPKSAPSLERIDQLVAKTLDVAKGGAATQIIMEWSAGKKHGRIGRETSGLAVLGQAQGEIRRALIDAGYPIETVRDTEWTGRESKQGRSDRVALEFPEYRKFRDEDGMDEGLDASDAIALGLRYLTAMKLVELAGLDR